MQRVERHANHGHRHTTTTHAQHRVNDTAPPPPQQIIHVHVHTPLPSSTHPQAPHAPFVALRLDAVAASGFEAAARIAHSTLASLSRATPVGPGLAHRHPLTSPLDPFSRLPIQAPATLTLCNLLTRHSFSSGTPARQPASAERTTTLLCCLALACPPARTRSTPTYPHTHIYSPAHPHIHPPWLSSTDAPPLPPALRLLPRAHG